TLGEAASIFYGDPSHQLHVAGVTGTNGKTTVAFIMQHLIASSKGRCGMLGTIRYDMGDGKTVESTHTTPDSVELHRLLDVIRNNGCAGVAMEVSSHAIDQKRIAGIEFDASVFTNLTQDHLDYHGGMDAYFEAKAGFFEHLTNQTVKKQAGMIINTDDPAGRKLAERFAGKACITTYGMGYGVDFRVSDITTTISMTSYSLEVKGRSLLVRLPLIGRFNVFNSVAALAAVHCMGYNLREAVVNLAQTPQVPGRLQSVGSQKNFRVFVDYAHTPDALENVLKTLRGLSPRRIITVFGCGGDRDATKRPLMGGAVESLSDHIIITSDNPRSEDPEKILSEIEKGMRGRTYTKIVDREAAISLAVEIARDGDIILIAGKGHENYQIFADRTIAFDDVKVAARFLRDKKIASE
ncbi:MAG: UDP-N-acetylmuramoyl-L-alanyl-D-glutamate--2,6-diaminopimelate ligase, partial [Verrucomicrobiaceae bacterium]